MNAPHKPAAASLDLPDLAARPADFGTARISPPLGKTQEERDAAWARFVATAEEGWTSDGTKMTRDEMNERW